MPLALEELVETAVENQHVILQKELEKGIPLNYIDQDGHYVLRYPDGHIEKTSLPVLENMEQRCQGSQVSR